MASYKVYKPSGKIFTGDKSSTKIKDIPLSLYSINSKQIAGQGGAIDETATLYTTPSGYTFFVTHLNLEVIQRDSSGTSSAQGKIYLNGQTIIRLYSPWAQGSVVTNSISFSQPFILRSNETIKVYSAGTDEVAQAGYSGFLVKNSDIFSS